MSRGPRGRLLARVRDLLKDEARQRGERMGVTVPGLGRAVVPFEFWPMFGSVEEVRVVDPDVPPSTVLEMIRGGAAVVPTGEFARAVGILKFLDRMGKGVLPTPVPREAPNRFERSRREQSAVRDALHRLATVVSNGRVQSLRGCLFSGSRPITRWIEGGEVLSPGAILLVPLRKVLRIASDIKRLEVGVRVPALGADLIVFPSVFPPVDQKVVDLFAECVDIEPGERVLDVGTGTGVLALLAARRGGEVTATDRNPQAVACTEANAGRLGLSDRIQVVGPSDLFGAVPGERFRHVIFNAPWLAGTPRTVYESALYDDGRVIERFIDEVGSHLGEDGSVWLLYSDVFERTGDGALANIKGLLGRCGLGIARQWKTVRSGRVSGRRETVVLYEIRSIPAADSCSVARQEGGGVEG